jgi:hypothetical protein
MWRGTTGPRSEEKWADEADLAGKPFVVTARGYVPEVVVLLRKDASERHRGWVDPALSGMAYMGMRRGGDPAKKLSAIFTAVAEDSKALLTNMYLDRADSAPSEGHHEYAALERAVSTWSLRQWENFRGDICIKLKNKQPISQFELDCSSAFAQLGAWVGHRAEVSDDVYYLGSERLERLCPGSYEEHATAYAKSLRTYRWSSRLGEVVESTLGSWVDEDDHEKCSLLLLGDAEIGKSKLAMLVAQEYAKSERTVWV